MPCWGDLASVLGDSTTGERRAGSSAGSSEISSNEEEESKDVMESIDACFGS